MAKKLPRASEFILSEEYGTFRSMLNEELPPTYDEWLDNKTREDAKHTANGIIINKVFIHPQEYSEYCKNSGLDTNLTTLNAFAVNKMRREEIAGKK